MQKRFDDHLETVPTDVVSLQKPDGRLFENIRTRVPLPVVMILKAHLPIEPWDVLSRSL